MIISCKFKNIGEMLIEAAWIETVPSAEPLTLLDVDKVFYRIATDETVIAIFR